MSGVNKVLLVGHLGSQPDFRRLADNVAVLTFELATIEELIKGGIKTEHTEWHHIIMWRALAETAFKALQRSGMLISIEGKLTTRNFIDKENIKRYTTEIIADKFILLR